MISNNIVVFSYSVLAEELIQTPEASPELTKRSWFGSLMSTDRDETYTIIVKEKPLASIKADLVQAFLSVSIPFTSTQKVLPGCYLVCYLGVTRVLPGCNLGVT